MLCKLYKTFSSFLTTDIKSSKDRQINKLQLENGFFYWRAANSSLNHYARAVLRATPKQHGRLVDKLWEAPVTTGHPAIQQPCPQEVHGLDGEHTALALRRELWCSCAWTSLSPNHPASLLNPNPGRQPTSWFTGSGIDPSLHGTFQYSSVLASVKVLKATF